MVPVSAATVEVMHIKGLVSLKTGSPGGQLPNKALLLPLTCSSKPLGPKAMEDTGVIAQQLLAM